MDDDGSKKRAETVPYAGEKRPDEGSSYDCRADSGRVHCSVHGQ
jgi:hypothetical protein